MLMFATRVARFTRPSVEGDAGVRFATLISSKLPVNVPVGGVISVPVFNSCTVCGPCVTSIGDEHEPTGTRSGFAAEPGAPAATPVTT